MTTIAYRSGVMAADSRVTACDVVILPERARKLLISERHGCVYAIAGAANEATELVRRIDRLQILPWYSSESFETDLGNDVQLLIGQHDGRLFSFECGFWAEVESEFTAIGSGTQAAIAAMYMGASAPDAVKIASLCDAGTDTNVFEVNLFSLKRPDYLKSVEGESRKKSPSSSLRSCSKTPRKRRTKAPSDASLVEQPPRESDEQTPETP